MYRESNESTNHMVEHERITETRAIPLGPHPVAHAPPHTLALLVDAQLVRDLLLATRG
jgi:hypothetical protein